MKFWAIWIAMIAVTAIPLAANAEPTPTTRPSFRESYGSVVEHNVFMRERTRPKPVERTNWRPSPPSAPRPPEESFVLTGVVFEGSEIRAYVENQRESRLLTLSEGESIAGGVISQITIDAIEYQNAAGTRWVQVGQDFTGTTIVPVRPVTTSPTTSTASGAVAGATTSPVSPGMSDAAQRMRERRMREQQGGR